VVRQALPWVGTWLALLLLWMLYVDLLDVHELAVGAVAAAIGATAVDVVRRQRMLRVRLKLRWLGRAWRLPVRMIEDFGSLVRVLWDRLVRGRHVRGSFRRVPVDGRGNDGRSVARRALLIAAGSFAPNVYVIDLRPGASSALVHRLVARPGSDDLVPGG
jgi:multisubunit Na+/H+ antiporter MnhE subunit